MPDMHTLPWDGQGFHSFLTEKAGYTGASHPCIQHRTFNEPTLKTMNTRTVPTTLRRSFSAAALSLFLVAGLHAQDQAAKATTLGTQEISYMTCTVTQVDVKGRLVTLQDEFGMETVLAVGDEVQRLDEVKAGDKLEIGYMESIGLEFREATAEEMAEPLKVTEMSDRAGKKQAPAGATMETTRAVVTIEGMNRLLNTMTVRGPLGNYLVISVDPGMVKWEDLRIGQTLVGTYSEAMVMSIDPVKKK